LGLKGGAGAEYTWLMNGFGSFWDGQYYRAYQFLQEIAKGATDPDREKFRSWFLWYEGLAAAHTDDFARAEANFRIMLTRAEKAASLGGGATLAFTQANHYRYTLACILDMEGKSRDAVALLQEALTEDVGLYMAHVRLASIYEDQHRPQAALEERRRAVASSPDDPSLLFDLGDALARAGELPEAQAVLRQARQANPRNVRALYVLGYVASQVGNIDEARDAYQQFLALAPSRFDEQKAEVAQRLQALK
jgi:Flp pilus assembly protein TadD